MSKNFDKLVRDVFDKEKVFVHCEKHLYVGDVKHPPKGKGAKCPNCWQAFFISLFGLCQDESRVEQTEDLLAVGKRWEESIKKGEIPAIPISHPKVN